MTGELNPTAASLLGFLEDGEQTGYRLAKVAEELIGDFWSVTRSQVYRELATLCERGLIEASGAGPRSARPYRLTARGHEAFLAWLTTPPPPEHIRFPLLLTLSFGRWLDPDAIRAMVTGHRRIHTERLARYQAIGDIADPYSAAVLSFGVHYERAVLEWIDTVLPTLPR
jgi:DNA-binding PadR family transcriptional regulator